MHTQCAYAYITQLCMCEDTRSIYGSRISGKFICVIMEKKRDAINDYLINNHKGDVRKRFTHTTGRKVGRIRRRVVGGRRERERERGG